MLITRIALGLAGLLAICPSEASAQSSQLQSASAVIAPRLAEARRKTVAVVDFNDAEGRTSCLGRFLAEEFSSALANAATGFEVIERTQLKLILDEQKLSTTGLIDAATSRRLGRIAGADTLVSATMTPLGDTVRVLIKAFDTEGAQLLASAGIDIPRTNAINELLSCGTNRTAIQRDNIPGANVPSAQVITRGGVSYSLEQCRSESASLVCELSLSHKLPVDQTVAFRKIVLFDRNGGQLAPSRVEGGQSLPAYRLLTVISGATARLRVWFDRIPAGGIGMLEFDANQNDRDKALVVGWDRLQFRNLSVIQ